MTSEKKSFSGAKRYVLDDELAKIVNISMALEMPLLLKGEPGTEKLCLPTPLRKISACLLLFLM